jgi:hypothetical protein
MPHDRQLVAGKQRQERGKLRRKFREEGGQGKGVLRKYHSERSVESAGGGAGGGVPPPAFSRCSIS